MLTRSLSVCFDPAYGSGLDNRDSRFPEKKHIVVESLLRAAPYADRLIWRRPPLVSRRALQETHDAAYVDAVIDGTLSEAALRKIGFLRSDDLGRRARLSCGGTLLAGDIALAEGFAVNAAGGSHHAGPHGGAGYCVFNDVAVAALSLLRARRVGRVLIVDCDVHRGDGTAAIFAAVPEVFTLSVHCADNWPRSGVSSDLDLALPPGTGEADYLPLLARSLQNILDAFCPDLVFYNAGVDVHKDDAMGKLAFSDDGLRDRERLVVSACSSRNIPLACVLGGGYGADASAVARRHLFLFEAILDDRRRCVPAGLHADKRQIDKFGQGVDRLE